MTFEEIINTVSAQDIYGYKGGNAIQDSIALVGRLIVKAHVAWDEFPTHLQNRFKKRIEQLYENPPTDNVSLLKELARVILCNIPDGHTGIFDERGKYILTKEEIYSVKDAVVERVPETQVGEHSVYTLATHKDYTSLFFKHHNQNGFGLFETVCNGQRIGVIALSEYYPFPDYGSKDYECFLGALKEHGKKWDYIIYDVRGNYGGSSFIIDDIATFLYGSHVPFIEGFRIPKTAEARVLHEHHFNQTQVNEIYKDEKAPFYELKLPPIQPFDARKGIAKPIYILTDRNVCSTTEFVCGLKAHPHVKFVGENTRGCFVYANVRLIPLPCGGQIKMGTFRFNVNFPEGIGHEPDIHTPAGQDAFAHVLSIIDKNVLRNKQIIAEIKKQEK